MTKTGTITLYRILMLQIAVVVLGFMLIAMLQSTTAAWSWSLGGVVSVLGTLVGGLRALVLAPTDDPKKTLRGLYSGEILKILVTAFMFYWIVKTLTVIAVYLFSGFMVATLLTYWVMLLSPPAANN